MVPLSACLRTRAGARYVLARNTFVPPVSHWCSSRRLCPDAVFNGGIILCHGATAFTPAPIPFGIGYTVKMASFIHLDVGPENALSRRSMPNGAHESSLLVERRRVNMSTEL